MAALICGSMAFDCIMVFPDRFRNHMLPEQVHILNVSFMVPQMRREFGGCAGNIAYSLQLLDGDGKPMATVGRDFAPYAEWMDRCGISREYVTVIEESYTAQAYITTDLDDNQITAFHPGAMTFSERNRIPDGGDINLGIVSPDARQGMIDHAQQFADMGVPFVFDPGQGMPLFNGEELLRFVEQASWVTVNDYESRLMQERTGLPIGRIAERVDAVIVTKGADGSVIYTAGRELPIPSATPGAVEDPTGCGDAYRAGLLYGLMNDFDWETTGRVAALMGAIKIERHGTQNHTVTPEAFAQRFEENFGYRYR